jgi:ATP synthase proteolipid subunit
MGVLAPGLVMKSIIPVIMAGVIGIYGLIIAVFLASPSKCYLPSILLINFCLSIKSEL